MDALPRRQNRSCDRCRRSKRRCIIIPSGNGASPSCRNCIRLGDRCTFEFAATISARKRQQVHASNQSNYIECGSPVEANVGASAVPAPARTSHPLDSYCSPIFFGSFDNIWSPPSFASGAFDIDDIFGQLLNGPSDSQDVLTLDRATQGWLSSDNALIRTQDVEMDRAATSGTSHLKGQNEGISDKLPTALLTSTLSFSMENDYLNRFFHSLTTVLYHRYLSPRANLTARTFRYEILPNDTSSKELRTRDDAEHGLLATDSLVMRDTGSETIKVSVIGAARFLDNFALMYGNHRARGDLQQDERILHLVMHTIALGHSPVSAEDVQQTDSHNKSVADVWYRAYRSLVESMSRRSFVLIYAVFTFDLAATAPDIIRAEHPEVDTKILLHDALHKLGSLCDLIHAFQSHLSKSSKYRKQLETCLRIMRWHGYVRDTVSALTTQQQCVLEDMPQNTPNSPLPTLSLDTDDLLTLDKAIPIVCEYAFGQIFAAYRLVVATDARVSAEQTSDTFVVSHDISPVKEMLESFHTTYDVWIQRCMDAFLQLSPKSQLSAGFLVIFWNLAILRIFDIFSAVGDSSVFGPDDVKFINEYRQRAVSAYARIAQFIMHVSEDEDLPILEQSGVKLSFLAHHANPVLVAFAFETAIKHTMTMIVDGSEEDAVRLKDALKPLCWCLLSLERTIAGRAVARPALHRLLVLYGDVLLDSWYPDDDRSSLTDSSLAL